MLDSGAAHCFSRVVIEGEFGKGVGPCGLFLGGFDGEDEACVLFWLVVDDDFFGASLVGGDDGEGGGLGFHDDLAEGVGGGGECEEVGACVEGGEFLFVFEAEEMGVVVGEL